MSLRGHAESHAEASRELDDRMNIGIIGLGRMGANMAKRLLLGGHNVVGFDFSKKAVKALQLFGKQDSNKLGRESILIKCSGEFSDAAGSLLPVLSRGLHRGATWRRNEGTHTKPLPMVFLRKKR